MWQLADNISHIRMKISWEEQLGGKTNCASTVPVQGKKDSKTLGVNPVGVAVVRETSILTGESIGEAHGILIHTQAHPPTHLHPKGQFACRYWGK